MTPLLDDIFMGNNEEKIYPNSRCPTALEVNKYRILEEDRFDEVDEHPYDVIGERVE